MGTRASLSFRYIAPPRARRKRDVTLYKLYKYLLPRPDSSELHHPPFKSVADFPGSALFGRGSKPTAVRRDFGVKLSECCFEEGLRVAFV